MCFINLLITSISYLHNQAANTVLRDYFLGKLSKNDSVPKHQPKQSGKDRSEVTKNGPNGNNLQYCYQEISCLKLCYLINQNILKNLLNGLGINLKYDREVLLSCSKSPYSKQLPKKWSAEWEQVKNENPTLFCQVVSGKGQQINGLCQENKYKYSNFVQSHNEDSSKHENNNVRPKTTVIRAESVGDKRLDNNNNSQIKKFLNAKPKRWDDSLEQWVEVDE